MYTSTLPSTSPLDGVGGQRHAPAAFPPGKTRYPLYRRLGGPQGRSGRVRKISHPPGLDPRTFQPVTSRYTDWVTPAPICVYIYIYIYIYIYYLNLFLYNVFRVIPGGKTAGAPTPSIAEVKGTVELQSTPPLCLHGVLWGELEILAYTYIYIQFYIYIYITNVAWPDVSYMTKISCPCQESKTSRQ